MTPVTIRDLIESSTPLGIHCMSQSCANFATIDPAAVVGRLGLTPETPMPIRRVFTCDKCKKAGRPSTDTEARPDYSPSTASLMGYSRPSASKA